MAAGPDIKIQGSWGPNGFMLNVYAETLDEWTDLLEAVQPTLTSCIEHEQEIKALRNLAPLTGGASAAPSYAATEPAGSVPPVPAQQAPPSDAPSCVHGAMIRRTGTHATRGPWAGWFCPTPKGTPDQCKAQFEGK
jgi:hypothetical protein